MQSSAHSDAHFDTSITQQLLESFLSHDARQPDNIDSRKMAHQRSLLQILQHLSRHLDAQHTIATTPSKWHGIRIAAIPLTGEQMVDLWQVSKWLGRHLDRPDVADDDAGVRWPDIDATISVSMLLANLVRLVANVAWSPMNRTYRHRSILAGQIVMQLATALGVCAKYADYHNELMGRVLNLVGTLAPRPSTQRPIRLLMKKIHQWLCTVGMEDWSTPKMYAVYNACRVLSSYVDRKQTKSARKCLAWVRLVNMSYALLDELAAPRNGQQVAVMILIQWFQPALLIHTPAQWNHSMQHRTPKFATIHAFIDSQKPGQLDTDVMVMTFATNLFAKQKRLRVDAIMQLEFLSNFSYDRVVETLPTIKSAMFDHKRFLSGTIFKKLHHLGEHLEQFRAERKMPYNRMLIQFRAWVHSEDRHLPATEFRV